MVRRNSEKIYQLHGSSCTQTILLQYQGITIILKLLFHKLRICQKYSNTRQCLPQWFFLWEVFLQSSFSTSLSESNLPIKNRADITPADSRSQFRQKVLPCHLLMAVGRQSSTSVCTSRFHLAESVIARLGGSNACVQN